MSETREGVLVSKRLSSSFCAELRRAARRALPAASLTGVGAFLVAAALFAGGLAGARGPTVWPPQFDATPIFTAPSVAPEGKVREKSARRSAVAGVYGGNSVCVRLCDGFFFPNSYASGGDAACAAQCPDAPTALYIRPAGSEDIGAAVSLQGTLYSALPVANREQTTFDETCTCHRSGQWSYLKELLHDHTLRTGDLVMTAKGVRVFQSERSGAIAPQDFVALGRASRISKDARAALMAIERAGNWDRHYGPYSYYNASGAPDKDAANRRHRGTVTVDAAPEDPAAR